MTDAATKKLAGLPLKVSSGWSDICQLGWDEP